MRTNQRNHYPEHISQVMARAFMQHAVGDFAHVTPADYTHLTTLLRDDMEKWECYATEHLGRETISIWGTIDITLSDSRYEMTLSYDGYLTIVHARQWHSEVGCYEYYTESVECNELNITSYDIYDEDGTSVVNDFDKNQIKI